MVTVVSAAVNPGQFCRTLVELPPAKLRFWGWQANGLCRSHDTATFYPEGSSAAKSATVDKAKSLCRRCPVRTTCLDHALRTREPHGVWGGFTPTERARMLETDPSTGASAADTVMGDDAVVQDRRPRPTGIRASGSWSVD
ncbi:WhiB family transcriptional regulator [Rhodococcoides kroppenstedtii]|uniref:WhiB family transcriptional regulator n=1 Tax=Rhodococcoides kroppenstedtii TaxID=293050 RepID=UPI0036453012